MDRNKRSISRIKVCIESLSARRAWIEISLVNTSSVVESVALRKESVDRNSVAFVFGFGAKRRSPQGERG